MRTSISDHAPPPAGTSAIPEALSGDRQASPQPNQAIVLYDGECPLCQRSVRVLQRLDWFRRLAFQNARRVEELPHASVELHPQKLLEEMHLLPPSRAGSRDRAYAGFTAFRWMAWRLPLLLPLAPLLYLPGVPWLGHRVYRWIAKNRFNLVPCHDGQCRLPLKKSAITPP